MMSPSYHSLPQKSPLPVPIPSHKFSASDTIIFLVHIIFWFRYHHTSSSISNDSAVTFFPVNFSLLVSGA